LKHNRVIQLSMILTMFLLVCSCKTLSMAVTPTDLPAVPTESFQETAQILTDNQVGSQNPPGNGTVVESAHASVPVKYASDACLVELKKDLDEAYGNEESPSNDNRRSISWSKSKPDSDDGSVTLVTYTVKGDKISSPVLGKKIPSEYKKYTKDSELHNRIWKLITDIIPLDQRKDLDQFILFTDGQDSITGSVGEGSTPDTWSVEIDVLDSENLATLSTTLVHEFGHMLTLGASQVKYYADTCQYYMASDGCSREDSYINGFYNQFWWNLYDEWKSYAKPDENGEVNEDGAYAFYEKHPDQFVSDYAATHPEEDIAESWTYFIYSDVPKGDTIAEQKIQFFYMFPELVEMRRQMQNNLCNYSKE